MSEAARYRHLTTKYCQGAGLDVASGGDPVVPWAWQLELSSDHYHAYTGNQAAPPPTGVQLLGDATHLPVESGTLDFVHASHIIEDYGNYVPIMREWVRVLKPGGYLVILAPEKHRWAQAMARGQPPNPNHKLEPEVGYISSLAPIVGCTVVEERLTYLDPTDYSILAVLQKK